MTLGIFYGLVMVTFTFYSYSYRISKKRRSKYHILEDIKVSASMRRGILGNNFGFYCYFSFRKEIPCNENSGKKDKFRHYFVYLNGGLLLLPGRTQSKFIFTSKKWWEFLSNSKFWVINNSVQSMNFKLFSTKRYKFMLIDY